MTEEKPGVPAILDDVQLPAPAIQRGIEPHQWNALKKSVFRGASDDMLLTVIDYCKARGLDPIKRPVHIVSVWDPKTRQEIETIWEGIASHRTTASRTGFYAGQDEPKFGPTIEKGFGANDVKMEYPEWCKVAVYRMVEGQRVPFVGVCRWIETFAAKKDGSPNRMWRKRPWGQIAKCAEAEALRKAFPDEIGGRPTAEEMEGQVVSQTSYPPIYESEAPDVPEERPQRSDYAKPPTPSEIQRAVHGPTPPEAAEPDLTDIPESLDRRTKKPEGGEYVDPFGLPAVEPEPKPASPPIDPFIMLSNDGVETETLDPDEFATKVCLILEEVRKTAGIIGVRDQWKINVSHQGALERLRDMGRSDLVQQLNLTYEGLIESPTRKEPQVPVTSPEE